MIFLSHKNITYIGTPYQLSYKDIKSKFVCILDESLHLEKITLDLTKKICLKMTPEELLNFKDDKNKKLK